MVFFNLILFFKKSVFHLTFSKHGNKMPCGKRVPFRSPPAPPRRVFCPFWPDAFLLFPLFRRRGADFHPCQKFHNFPLTNPDPTGILCSSLSSPPRGQPPSSAPPAPPAGAKKRIPVQELKSRLFSFSFLFARIFWGLIRLLGQKKRIALQEFKIDSAESGVLR